MLKSSLLRFALFSFLSFLAIIVLFALWGLIFQPNIPVGKQEVDPEVAAAAIAKREVVFDPESQESYVVDVDYGEGPAASWRPKGESPILAELVEEGALPTVEERVGPEPLVMRGVDGIGRYGGTWMRVAASTTDMRIAGRLLNNGGSLFRWSPKGLPLKPNVAKSYERSEDYRIWTVHLRRGMRWSDGHPFTADDFEFAFEVFYPFDRANRSNPEEKGNIPWLQHRGKYGTFEKIDAYTIRFSFEDPHPLFAYQLAEPSNEYNPVYLPKHYLEKYVPKPGVEEESLPDLMEAMDRSGFSDTKSLITALVGFANPSIPRIGPWIYKQHQSNPPIAWVRNPYHFAVDEEGNQLPYIDEVLFQIQQEKQIATTLASGGVSMQHRHARFADYTLLMSNRDQNSVRYDIKHWYPGERSAWALFPNLQRRPSPGDPQSENKAAILKRREFRQALSLAIDRQAIIDTEYSGVGTPSQLEPGSASPFHSEMLAQANIAFDPQKANRLLDEIGLDRRDSQGFRLFPDGMSMTWFIDYTSYTGPGPVEMVIDYWSRVGIRARSRERTRALFQIAKDNGWGDFTIWSGFAEVEPLVRPRSFAPIRADGMLSPFYGRWFEQGGFYGRIWENEAENRLEPPAGSPSRQAMTLVDRIRSAVDPEKSEGYLRELFELNAREVWTINIATPPPVLVVVDRELRNVPDVAVQTFYYGSPGNTGPDTYFFASDAFATGTPRISEAKFQQLKAAVTSVEPNPNFYILPASGFSLLGSVLKWLFIGAGTLVVAMFAFRHPFVGKRLAIMVPTLGIISVVSFAIIQAPPGSYIETRIAQLEAQGTANAEDRKEKLEELYWLDDPGWVRYLRWMGLGWFLTFDKADSGLLQGNLGRSMETDQIVNSIVGDRLVLTVAISAGTIVFTWLLAVPIGIYSAVRQYSIGDYAFTVIGFLGMCIPNFLLALLLGYWGRVAFGIDMTGLFSPQYATQPDWDWPKFVDLLKHIWVPVVVMGTSGTAGMMRVMRGNLLDELKRPYVTTALAKGVRPLKLLLKYPVRLAINPFISTIGGLFPTLVSGGAIVAIVLSLPTVGPLLLNALLNEDMYMAGSMLMILSLLGVIGTLVSDLLLLWLDPRIRMEGGSR